MDTFDAIATRRSVKWFDPEYCISQEETRKLLESVMLTPTAFNIQHWRFLVVDDPALRNQLRPVCWNQAQITDASLLVFICADLRAWQKQPERYWRNAPQEVQDMAIPGIGSLFKGNEQLQRDEAIRSGSLAGQTLMLAATAMGYQSCPLTGYDQEKVAEIINLPSDHILVMAVVVGKGTKKPWPRPGQLAYDEVVQTNRFED
jgi:nitroreductase